MKKKKKSRISHSINPHVWEYIDENDSDNNAKWYSLCYHCGKFYFHRFHSIYSFGGCDLFVHHLCDSAWKQKTSLIYWFSLLNQNIQLYFRIPVIFLVFDWEAKAMGMTKKNMFGAAAAISITIYQYFWWPNKQSDTYFAPYSLLALLPIICCDSSFVMNTIPWMVYSCWGRVCTTHSEIHKRHMLSRKPKIKMKKKQTRRFEPKWMAKW